MARIFLDANESRNGALAANDTVFGNTGTESVGINTGATNVRVEGTVEAVTLPGAPSAFTYRAEGNNLVVFSGGVQIARIIVQDDANGTLINFTGGSVTANVGAGGLTLGGTVVPTATGPVDPIDFDETAQLTASLNALADAQEARADFLASEEADLDDDATTPTTEAEIADNLADAQATLAAQPTAAQLDAAVNVAEADLAAAQADVNAVGGLNEAIGELRAAQDELGAAREARTAANAEANAAEARYTTLNPTGAVDVAEDGTVTRGGDDIIVLNDNDELVLADGVTERNNAGVTELLAALVNRESADAAAQSAASEVNAAQDAVDLLDTVPGADAERAELADFNDVVTAYEAALDAYDADSEATEDALVEAYEALLVALDGNQPTSPVVTGVDSSTEAAAIAADAEVSETGEAINAQENDLEEAILADEGSNPRYDELVAAEDSLADAEDAVEDREEAVADVQDAQALSDQLSELSDDVDAATTAIEDQGFETPILIDGPVTATAGSDIFVGAGENGSIGRFGRAGDDLLFVGSDLSLVELETGDDIETDGFGSATRLEAFIQQDGANTVIFIEEQAFQGSEADGGFDGYTITLTGVQSSNVTFENGYFSIA
jgi:hypothetical protein